MSWFLHCLRYYARFKGRASRPEFWWFWGIATFVNIVLYFIGSQFFLSLVGVVLKCVWALVTTIPFLAVTSRRLHDSGHSFWWAGAFYVGIAILMFAGLLIRWLPLSPPQGNVPALLFGLYLLAWFGLFIRLFYLLFVSGEPGGNRYGDPAPTLPT